MLTARGVKAGVWGIADQALLSVTNLAVGLLLARELSPAAFGLFVITFAVILAGGSVQVSLVTDPLLILGATRKGPDQSRYFASLLWLQVIVSLSVAACIVIVSETTRFATEPHSPLAHALTAAAAVIVPIQMQGLFRAVMFCRLRAAAVFWNDLIYCVIRLAMMAILFQMERLSVYSALVAGGAAASIAAVAAAPACRDLLLSRAQRLRTTWRAHWDYGRWLLATSAAFWFSGQAPALVASAFLSPVAAAVLKACQYFVAPLNVAFTGLDGVLAPRVSRRKAEEGDGAVARFLRLFSLAAAAGVAVYALVLLPFTPTLLEFIYKGRYRGYAPIVLILLVDALLSALARGPILKLKVMGDTRRIFMGYLCAAVAGLGTMAVLAPMYGIVGAAFSAPVASAALLGALLMQRAPSAGTVVVVGG